MEKITLLQANTALTERNRLLVLENDEQTAEIEKLKQAITKVSNHLEGVMNPKRLIMLDCYWAAQTLNNALEETK